MGRRSWARILAGGLLVAGMLVAGGGTAVQRGSMVTTSGLAPATATLVPMPDLAIAHRLPAGGMNLWRLPVSEYDPDYGTPQLVKTLNYGGFSYDQSVTLAGDFGDVTASDDGTADHVIWHAQPNGGVLLWGVGGGGDPTPRLWADLRTGGWSYAASTPMVADVNGDGWDDLVVHHTIAGTYDENLWVFLSDGRRLGAPQLWLTEGRSRYERDVMADFNGDGLSDRLTIQTAVGMTGYELAYEFRPTVFDGRGDGIQDIAFQGPASAGWSYGASRTLAGDVTGDGRPDIVTIHAQPGGGILAWVHVNCFSSLSDSPCFQPPVVWQDLRTGGWSFAGSRQYLADTDGDGRDDLISVHSQGGNPGELVWRAQSSGWGFSTPQIVANLKTGGWTYLSSRESVADVYGQY